MLEKVANNRKTTDLVKFNKRASFLKHKKFFSTISATDNQPSKQYSKSILHFNTTTKTVITIALITIILVSCFIFYPKGSPTPETPIADEPTPTPNITITATPTMISSTPTPKPSDPISEIVNAFQQVINSKDHNTEVVKNSQVVNSTVWRQIANYAWSYFQPGIGVDNNTGLPASGEEVSYFTDWDIGVYLQAVMDAQKIGLITSNETWGSSERIEKIMHFLETRPINTTTNYPFWFYQNDGTDYHELSDKMTDVINVADTGRLFVALNNVKIFNSSLANRIDNFVKNNSRSYYAGIVPDLKSESMSSKSIYAYYIISGYASFWSNELGDAPNRILNNIISSPTTKTSENVSLPISRLTMEPIVSSIFEMGNNSQLAYLANKTYSAHEAFFNSTSKYRAFSEGNTFTSDWAYEWVVFDNETWVIRNEVGRPIDITPIVYTKIAFSFLALYNTSYARNTVVYIEEKMLNPTSGYSNGVDETGTTLGGTGLHTNGVILGAARYAIQNNP
jgi:hypothetical protein